MIFVLRVERPRFSRVPSRIYSALSRRWRYDARAFLYPLYDHDILNRVQAFSILLFGGKKRERELCSRIGTSPRFLDAIRRCMGRRRRNNAPATKGEVEAFSVAAVSLRDRPRQYLKPSYFPAFSFCVMKNCVTILFGIFEETIRKSARIEIIVYRNF